MHLMALGLFVFEIPSLAYSELQRRMDWRHARSGRIGARDAAQFVGPGEDTICLQGAVYTEIADGPASLASLREMADQGEALPLVDGSGTVLGSYVITALDERQTAFHDNGRPRRIDFALDLMRVADPLGEAEATA
ncbi:MAG TPA: phage tail protein [Pedomonas sp.]|uniref:phage tail protein n=1 Tax=Pedomonas sp. TaxID=2976421 RepID=UPI002F407151